LDKVRELGRSRLKGKNRKDKIDARGGWPRHGEKKKKKTNFGSTRVDGKGGTFPKKYSLTSKTTKGPLRRKEFTEENRALNRTFKKERDVWVDTNSCLISVGDQDAKKMGKQGLGDFELRLYGAKHHSQRKSKEDRRAQKIEPPGKRTTAIGPLAKVL